MKKWLHANKLALNMKKTNFVLFHSAVKRFKNQLFQSSDARNHHPANHVKFLGVLLDETLSWKFHLIELSRKLSRDAGIFYKLSHFVPKEMLKTVYYSLFLSFSVLWYCGVACYSIMKSI